MNNAQKVLGFAITTCVVFWMSLGHAPTAKADEKNGRDFVAQIAKALNARDYDAAKELVAEFEKIGALGQPAVPDLIAMLKINDVETKITAVHLLGVIGPDAKAALPEMIFALSDENMHVQYWTCRALAKFGPAARDATPELIKQVRNGKPSVRRHAMMTLAAIGPEIGTEGVQVLEDVLYDKLHPIRSEAIKALGKLGVIAKPSAAAIRPFMKNDKYRVRTEAAFAIWSLTGDVKTTFPVLMEELKAGDAPWEAAEALGKMGPLAKDAVPALQELLQSEEPDIRAAAAASLGEIGAASKPAMADLEQLLEDGEADVRDSAKKALEKIRRS